MRECIVDSPGETQKYTEQNDMDAILQSEDEALVVSIFKLNNKCLLMSRKQQKILKYWQTLSDYYIN